MRTSRSLGVVAAALLSAATLVATGGMASAGATWTITPVLGGLNGPRGVAFDGQGSIYVAEAGAYSNIAPGSFGVSRTGTVRKFTVSDGRLSRSWSTGFDSVPDSTHGCPEVLGSPGVS